MNSLNKSGTFNAPDVNRTAHSATSMGSSGAVSAKVVERVHPDVIPTNFEYVEMDILYCACNCSV
jgi:hypothetical protein